MAKTAQKVSREQTVPMPVDDQTSGGVISVQVSPITAMRAMQLEVEGTQETIALMQISLPISEVIAIGIVGWAAANTLDWDHLIASDDGWGNPEP